MGRAVGAKNNRTYGHNCKYIECRQGFISNNPRSLYCSETCRQNDYNLRNRVRFDRFLKCRICGALLSLKEAEAHVTKHKDYIRQGGCNE